MLLRLRFQVETVAVQVRAVPPIAPPCIVKIRAQRAPDASKRFPSGSPAQLSWARLCIFFGREARTAGAAERLAPPNSVHSHPALRWFAASGPWASAADFRQRNNHAYHRSIEPRALDVADPGRRSRNRQHFLRMLGWL